MIKAFCFAEGDVYIGKNKPKNAIELFRGSNGTVLQILANECVLGVFNGRLTPCIKTVNDASKVANVAAFIDEKDPQGLQGDELGAWLKMMKEKYRDRPVMVNGLKETSPA